MQYMEVEVAIRIDVRTMEDVRVPWRPEPQTVEGGGVSQRWVEIRLSRTTPVQAG